MAFAASDNMSVDLWDKVLSNFKADDNVSLLIDSTDRRKILEEVLALVQATEQTSQQKRWKWKNKKGETVIVRDIFAKMVVWIEKFKAIGDNIVQYDPGHAALPWALARFLLQASINDHHTHGAILEGLELVFNLIAKLEVIEQLYLPRDSRGSKAQKRLGKAIETLYTSILEYLLESHRYFTQKTIVRVAKSTLQLEDITIKFIAAIKSKSGSVDEYVQLVSGEILKSTSDSISRFEKGLNQIDSRSQKLEDINMRTEKIQEQLDPEFASLHNILKDLGLPVTRMASQILAISDNLKEEERLKIFEWLSTVPYLSHHRSKEKALLPGSGQWLLEKPEFVDWISSSTSSILWLHGIPGSGKSMLVAKVVEYIQGRSSSSTSPAPLAYFYCARNANEPEREEPLEVLRTILEQLSCSSEDLPIREPVVKAYLTRKREARGRKPEKLSLEDIVEVLLELLDINPAIIVIDGLDECNPTKRQDLLDCLRTLIKDSSNIVKVFVSSRDDHDLVHHLSQTPNLYIHSTNNMGDISNFVRSRVTEAIAKERILCGLVSPGLKNVIINTLIKKAYGMFRLVSLHIERLCDPYQIKNEANVLNALNNLPKDLTRSYDTVMAQIANSQEPSPVLAEHVLKCLLCVQQTFGSKGFIMLMCADLDNNKLESVSEVLSICCNLVVFDGELDRFRFAHLSVQEYLEQLPGYSKSEVNGLAAELCLSWISRHRRTLAYESPLIKEDELGWSEVSLAEEARQLLIHEDRNWPAYPVSRQLLIHADRNWPAYTVYGYRSRETSRLQSRLQEFLLDSSPETRKPFEAWQSRLRSKVVTRSHSVSFISDPYKKVYTGDESSYSLAAGRFSSWISEPPDAVFVTCSAGLIDFLPMILREGKQMVSRNSIGKNCAQVAASQNQTATLRLLYAASKNFDLYVDDYYWHTVMVDTAAIFSLDALRAILDETGENFVTQNDLRDFVEKYLYSDLSDPDPVLEIFFKNNRSLSVDANVLESAFDTESDHHKLRLITGIFKFARGTQITDRFVRNVGRLNTLTYDIVNQVKLHSKNLRFDLGFVSAVLLVPQEPFVSLLIEKWDDVSRELDAPFAWHLFTRVQVIRELLPLDYRPRFGRLYDRKGDIPMITMVYEKLAEVEKELEITHEDLLFVKKDIPATDRACLLLLLELKPKVQPAALTHLIQYLDVEIIERILDYQSIKVTDDIIRSAAGNFKDGKKIIKLLLEREAAEDID